MTQKEDKLRGTKSTSGSAFQFLLLFRLLRRTLVKAESWAQQTLAPESSLVGCALSLSLSLALPC